MTRAAVLLFALLAVAGCGDDGPPLRVQENSLRAGPVAERGVGRLQVQVRNTGGDPIEFDSITVLGVPAAANRGMSRNIDGAELFGNEPGDPNAPSGYEFAAGAEGRLTVFARTRTQATGLELVYRSDGERHTERVDAPICFARRC